MDSNVDFEIWNHNDRGGINDTFTGAQGQDNITGNTDSLETAANTWVIVFNDTNYTGNSMKIGPQTYLDDLNDTDRYDSSGKKQGDWKNQIKSFILYKQQPSFWGGNSYATPSNTQLFSLHNGQTLFTENAGFLGDNRTFQAPYNCGDVADVGYTTNSDHMTGVYSISALSNGPGAWLIIFDDTDFNGNFLKINPGTPYKDLNDVGRYDLSGNKKGDWKNQIQSFLIYPSEPAFWSTSYQRAYIDFSTLFNLYPYPTSKVSDNKIVYVVEDSTYTVDCPEFAEQSATQQLSIYEDDDTTDLPTDGWTKYSVSLQHDNSVFVQNDTVNFDAYFDNSGNLVQIEHFEWSSKGAYQVSQQIIKSVDFIAWYLGTTGAIETLGISEEAADTFVDVFDFVTAAFNKIANLVYKATDNGGQFYFLPVVCHTINRICSTVSQPFNTTVYTDANDVRTNYEMAFSNSGFPGALKTAIGSSSSLNWQVKSGLISSSNTTFQQVVEYTYQGYPFRTWYQESSVSAGLGMFVSCKIDYEIGDNSKDDHIIILLGFKLPGKNQTVPQLTFAQATVQFTDGSNTNIITPPYNSVSGTGSANYTTDILNSVYSFIKNALANIKTDSNSEGRQYIADVTKDNMLAISNCMSFS